MSESEEGSQEVWTREGASRKGEVASLLLFLFMFFHVVNNIHASLAHGWLTAHCRDGPAGAPLLVKNVQELQKDVGREGAGQYDPEFGSSLLLNN